MKQGILKLKVNLWKMELGKISNILEVIENYEYVG